MNKEGMPRERLIKFGVDSLEDYELLAIMLGSGTKNENVLDLSKRLIKDYGLNRLLKMSYLELKNIKGVKEAKATKLMAAFELARRSERKIKKTPLTSSKAVYEFLKSKYLFKEVEELSAIFVDVKCRIIDFVIYNGVSASYTAIPVRELVSKAISTNCYGVFIAHNHPSGVAKPSKEDTITTKLVERILKDVGILLLDHIIIGNNSYYSFNDDNII